MDILDGVLPLDGYPVVSEPIRSSPLLAWSWPRSTTHVPEISRDFGTTPSDEAGDG